MTYNDGVNTQTAVSMIETTIAAHPPRSQACGAPPHTHPTHAGCLLAASQTQHILTKMRSRQARASLCTRRPFRRGALWRRRGRCPGGAPPARPRCAATEAARTGSSRRTRTRARRRICSPTTSCDVTGEGVAWGLLSLRVHAGVWGEPACARGGGVALVKNHYLSLREYSTAFVCDRLLVWLCSVPLSRGFLVFVRSSPLRAETPPATSPCGRAPEMPR